MNDISDYDYNNSSTFVCYTDYSNTSVDNDYVVVTKDFNQIKQPNETTILAMEAARKENDLIKFNNVNDFFTDLEK